MIRSTTTEPATAASPSAIAPEIATALRLMSPITGMLIATAGAIEVSALTATDPVASISTSPVCAVVVSSMMSIATDAPTAASEVESAPARARLWYLTSVEAPTVTSPVELRVAPEATDASETNVATLSVSEPATETSLEVPPLAAKPQAMTSLVCPAGVTASTVMPWPVSVESPTELVLVTVTWLNPNEAAMFASAESFSAVPIAFAIVSVAFVARTTTAPLDPVTVRPEPIDALFVTVIQLTAIDAAMPTPEPPCPDSLDDVELAESVESPPFGVSPVSFCVDGLLFTCLSVSASASSPSESLPVALEVVSTRLARDCVASTVTESPVALRSSAAVTVGDRIAIPTTAPIAASSPARLAVALGVDDRVEGRGDHDRARRGDPRAGRPGPRRDRGLGDRECDGRADADAARRADLDLGPNRVEAGCAGR